MYFVTELPAYAADETKPLSHYFATQDINYPINSVIELTLARPWSSGITERESLLTFCLRLVAWRLISVTEFTSPDRKICNKQKTVLKYEKGMPES